MSYPNIINSELKERFGRIVEGKDMALILYSLKDIVHGYYSTSEQKVPTVVPQIRYNGKDFLLKE